MLGPMTTVRNHLSEKRRSIRHEALTLDFLEAVAPPGVWEHLWPASVWCCSWDRRVVVRFQPAQGSVTTWAIDAISRFGESLLNLGFKVEEERRFEEKPYPKKVVLAMTLRVDTRPFGRWPSEPEHFELTVGELELGPHCAVESVTEQEYVEPTEGGWMEKTVKKVRCINPATGETVSVSEVK